MMDSNTSNRGTHLCNVIKHFYKYVTDNYISNEQLLMNNMLSIYIYTCVSVSVELSIFTSNNRKLKSDTRWRNMVI